MEPNNTTTKSKSTNAAAAASNKGKGGNDGKSPRALRGAPKASTNWSAADEARFQEQQKAREAFVVERTTSLKLITSLLLAGVTSTQIEAVQDDQGKVLAEARTLPVAATEEQLVAALEANGDAILTYLSKHYKLQPALLKKQ